ncbi:uncharacterized protein B0H18DRAFT_957630 [Fomitopsis serialis]|uniref:uncharacterized protein n=1 Tax=Fomitopsis serialis TaxID=139415 RepID=UPI002008A779|nr:uncharacterized protein B0H18DRAFT_957630 [Neoantrodia serialis]KAH9919279.1 hypothetical protein B0H18DRAFT_957630 [Neoantrodia serialis]
MAIGWPASDGCTLRPFLLRRSKTGDPTSGAPNTIGMADVGGPHTHRAVEVGRPPAPPLQPQGEFIRYPTSDISMSIGWPRSGCTICIGHADVGQPHHPPFQCRLSPPASDGSAGRGSLGWVMSAVCMTIGQPRPQAPGLTQGRSAAPASLRPYLLTPKRPPDAYSLPSAFRFSVLIGQLLAQHAIAAPAEWSLNAPYIYSPVLRTSISSPTLEAIMSSPPSRFNRSDSPAGLSDPGRGTARGPAAFLAAPTAFAALPPPSDPVAGDGFAATAFGGNAGSAIAAEPGLPARDAPEQDLGCVASSGSPALYGAQDFHQQWTWPAYLRPDYNRPWTRATVSLRDLLRTMIELVRDMQPHYHGDSRGVPDPTNSIRRHATDAIRVGPMVHVYKILWRERGPPLVWSMVVVAAHPEQEVVLYRIVHHLWSTSGMTHAPGAYAPPA